MTFDFQRAAGFDVMRNYNPSPLPPPPIWPTPTWYAPGWATNFLTQDIDTQHSVNALWEALRSYICPSRTQGGTHLTESFDNSTNLNDLGWLSWRATIVNVVDPDPGLNGNTLDLQTGPTLGDVAAIQRTLSPVPASFGVFILPKLIQVGSNPADSLNIQLQNNAGACLKVRFYDNTIETFVSGSWQLLANHGGNYMWENWIECVDKGNGTHDVQLYLGTQLCGTVNGTLSTGVMSPNNTLFISQNSSADNYRHSQIAGINVGLTQLSDHMIAVSPKLTPTASPTIGHLKIMVEDVSVNLVPNVNFKATISKDDCATWVPVTLCEHLPPWGKGEVDNTKDVRVFTGSAPFAAGSGQAVRWCIEELTGCLGVVQGVTMFWDC